MDDRDDNALAAPGGQALTPTAELLAELARRFRLRFGRLEVVFHDGRPSPRLTIEHRIQPSIDDGAPRTPRPPAPRRGKP